MKRHDDVAAGWRMRNVQCRPVGQVQDLFLHSSPTRAWGSSTQLQYQLSGRNVLRSSAGVRFGCGALVTTCDCTEPYSCHCRGTKMVVVQTMLSRWTDAQEAECFLCKNRMEFGYCEEKCGIYSLEDCHEALTARDWKSFHPNLTYPCSKLIAFRHSLCTSSTFMSTI